jgi:hypothetical protein
MEPDTVPALEQRVAGHALSGEYAPVSNVSPWISWPAYVAAAAGVAWVGSQDIMPELMRAALPSSTPDDVRVVAQYFTQYAFLSWFAWMGARDAYRQFSPQENP